MMDYTLTSQERALAARCLEIARSKGAQKARVTLNKSCMDLIGTLNGEVDKVSHCLDRSISIALFVDGKYGSFSINRLEESALEDFIEKAIATARLLAKDRLRDLPAPARTAKDATEGRELGLYDEACLDMDSERRLGIALGASIFKKTAPAAEWTLVSEEAEYSDSVFDTLVMDTQGLYCRHTETSFEYGVEMTVVDRDGNKYSGYWWNVSPRLAGLGAEGICDKALSRAVSQIGPHSLPSGKYRCVIDSECSSRVVTPLLNALGAYAVQQNNSFLCGKLGEKVFNEGLTIRDMCRNRGESGSRLFDSEGVATTEHDIISNGVVNEYFINTYMAGKMQMDPTVEDATRPKVMPWPEPGLDREAIMRRCGEGILVTGFNGGNSNAATGDYSFGVEGFAFKDGRVTHPVREMLITGNLVDLWNHFMAAGDDARPCKSKLIPTLAFENVDFSGE
jgi:PmbA protein